MKLSHDFKVKMYELLTRRDYPAGGEPITLFRAPKVMAFVRQHRLMSPPSAWDVLGQMLWVDDGDLEALYEQAIEEGYYDQQEPDPEEMTEKEECTSLWNAYLVIQKAHDVEEAKGNFDITPAVALLIRKYTERWGEKRPEQIEWDAEGKRVKG